MCGAMNNLDFALSLAIAKLPINLVVNQGAHLLSQYAIDYQNQQYLKHQQAVNGFEQERHKILKETKPV